MTCRPLAIFAALVLAVGAFVAYRMITSDDYHYSAYFSNSKGLYVGDDVRVLGVQVGEVTGIHPEGDRVRVTFSVPASQPIPLEVKAAIVSPSLVNGRFIQLAPAYTHGPRLPDHAVLRLADTAVPVEFDQAEKQLTQLANALGPKGADRRGAVSGLLRTTAANLGAGTAQRLRVLLTSLSQATTTLSGNRGDLFATVRNLDDFVSNLDRSDSAVRSFSAQLTQVSALLADNRTQLATAIDTVDQALGSVSRFVQSNRTVLKSSIDKLAALAQTLADKRSQLADILHVAPTALSNFYNIIDPRYNAPTGRISADNFQDAAQLVCGSITSLGGSVQSCRDALAPLVKLLGLGSLPVPGVPIGGLSTTHGAAGAVSAAPATGGSSSTPTLPGAVDQVTGTLNGLVGLLLPGGAR